MVPEGVGVVAPGSAAGALGAAASGRGTLLGVDGGGAVSCVDGGGTAPLGAGTAEGVCGSGAKGSSTVGADG